MHAVSVTDHGQAKHCFRGIRSKQVILFDNDNGERGNRLPLRFGHLRFFNEGISKVCVIREFDCRGPDQAAAAVINYLD